jgi:predicted HD superfamily hydrolase involved in NAD metabolism
MNQSIVARYLPLLEKILTSKRLEHSLGVMQVMGELAQVYGLDSEASLTAGLLHDTAKDLTPAQQAEILLGAKIEIRYECERDYSYYLHGPVGAYYVQRKLGITDPLILTAITTHTYYGNGAAFDAPICWCLRFADILEPTRNWNNVRWLRNGVGRLREAAYAGRLAEGAFLQTGWLIKWFGEVSVPIHPNMTRIYQDLSVVLDLNDSFLEQES